MKQHAISYMKCQVKKRAAITASGERDASTRLYSQEGRISGVGGKASEEPDFVFQPLAGSRESEYFDYGFLHPDA